MAEPKLSVLALEIVSPALPSGRTLSIKPGRSSTPVVLKEGVEYHMRLRFTVNGDTAGVRFIQVVQRARLKVDKLEQMLGAYAPSPDGQPYVQDFGPSEAPSGALARSEEYLVHSRIVEIHEDDHELHAEFEWRFKIAKDWE